MTTPIIRVKYKQCKASLEIQSLGIIVDQIQCTLHAGHKGLHVCARGKWMTQDRVQSIIENEGLK